MTLEIAITGFILLTIIVVVYAAIAAFRKDTDKSHFQRMHAGLCHDPANDDNEHDRTTHEVELAAEVLRLRHAICDIQELAMLGWSGGRWITTLEKIHEMASEALKPAEKEAA